MLGFLYSKNPWFTSFLHYLFFFSEWSSMRIVNGRKCNTQDVIRTSSKRLWWARNRKLSILPSEWDVFEWVSCYLFAKVVDSFAECTKCDTPCPTCTSSATFQQSTQWNECAKFQVCWFYFRSESPFISVQCEHTDDFKGKGNCKAGNIPIRVGGGECNAIESSDTMKWKVNNSIVEATSIDCQCKRRFTMVFFIISADLRFMFTPNSAENQMWPGWYRMRDGSVSKWFYLGIFLLYFRWNQTTIIQLAWGECITSWTMQRSRLVYKKVFRRTNL